MTNSIADLKKLAGYRGGDCLGASSSTSSHVNRNFRWICSEDHIWEARADSVRNGTWCRKCSTNRQKNTIDEMKLIAVKREGLCLSERYINAGTKLIWQCKSGHVFKVTPSHVKHGQWCRKCGATRAGIAKRLSMAEILKIARSRNGKCLSDSYNPKEKLKWQCDKGHIWEASVHSVKARSWCPVCSRIRSRRKPLTIAEMREIASRQGGLCLSPEYQNTDIKLKWQCKDGHVWWALP